MGDDRHLLGEALDMGRLFLDQVERDEDREIAVLMAGLADALIEALLDLLPDAKGPRSQNVTATDLPVLDHLGLCDHFAVPRREVALLRGDNSI